MDRFLRRLPVAAVVLVAGGIAVGSLTGSSGGAPTAPSTQTNTVAYTQTAKPAPAIKCWFRVDNQTGRVLHVPELLPADGLTKAHNVSNNCEIRVGTKGGASYVKLVTPTFAEGSYGVGNGVYPLKPTSISLAGSIRLAGQPKFGYKLACVSDHGVLKPAPAGTHLPVHDCTMVGKKFAYNYQGAGIVLSWNGHRTVYQAPDSPKHPGTLHNVRLTVG